MKLRVSLTGGIVEVDDETAARLIEAGGWEAADAPKPARKPRSPRTPKPAPAQEPTPQE